MHGGGLEHLGKPTRQLAARVALQHTLAPMYGKEVVVTASIAQLPKGHKTSIPEGALYFVGKFEPKLANPPK